MRNYSNIAVQTTLSSGINNSVTTLAVAAATGYPSVPYRIAIDLGLPTEELCDVTGAVGTTWEVDRGVDGTPAQAHDLGAVVVHVTSAQDHRDSQQHIAPTNVHGLSGGAAVVGTTTTQTLTNKTLTNPTINGGTFSGELVGTPEITNFSDAQHDHEDAAGGGVLTGLESRLAELESGASDLPLVIFGAQSQLSEVGVYTYTDPVVNTGSMWTVGSPTLVTISQPGIYQAGFSMKFDESGGSSSSNRYMGLAAIDMDLGSGFVIATEAFSMDHHTGVFGYAPAISMSWMGHLDAGDILRTRSTYSIGPSGISNHAVNFYVRCDRLD